MTPMGPSMISALPSPEDAQNSMFAREGGDPEHCGSCRFFRPSDMRCQKNPPMGGSWATVSEDDWCGAFEAGAPHEAHKDRLEELGEYDA